MGKIEILLEAKEDLIAKKIDVIIGWKKEDNSIESIPTFVENLEEFETLIIDDYCVNNLSKYLIDEANNGRKVGVFLKKCDEKGFEQIVMDNRIIKENIVIYKVSCNGMKNFMTNEIFRKCEECLDETIDKYSDVKEIEDMSYDEDMSIGWERCLNVLDVMPVEIFVLLAIVKLVFLRIKMKMF